MVCDEGVFSYCLFRQVLWWKILYQNQAMMPYQKRRFLFCETFLFRHIDSIPLCSRGFSVVTCWITCRLSLISARHYSFGAKKHTVREISFTINHNRPFIHVCITSLCNFTDIVETLVLWKMGIALGWAGISHFRVTSIYNQHRTWGSTLIKKFPSYFIVN